jgi:hypothetical protein
VLSFYEVWQGFITKALGRISKVYLEGTLYTLLMPHKKQEAPYSCKKPLTAHDLLTAKNVKDMIILPCALKLVRLSGG